MPAFIVTALAMLFFAANSISGRLALQDQSIDAYSYTFIRLISGALVLGILVYLNGRNQKPASESNIVSASWPSVVALISKNAITACALFFYALFFSLSYSDIETGTGALILFACVQLTMMFISLVRGDRLSVFEFAGMLLAFAGITYLLSPGASAPPIGAALLMAISGIAWGVYSSLGARGQAPLFATALNFALALIIMAVVYLIFARDIHYALNGVLLAVFSGAVASGIGYALWFKALPLLSSSSAATVQLSVPLIATAGGILLVGEALTLRLGLASICVLCGIYLSIQFSKN